MKKLIPLLLLLFVSIFTFGQTSRDYEYGTYQDQDLIKLKTETYLIQLKRIGFEITKNEITNDKIDIDIKYKSKDTYLKWNVVYLFLKNGYYVSYYSPVFFSKGKKISLKYDDENYSGLIEFLEDYTFKKYQNEMNSDF